MRGTKPLRTYSELLLKCGVLLIYLWIGVSVALLKNFSFYGVIQLSLIASYLWVSYSIGGLCFKRVFPIIGNAATGVGVFVIFKKLFWLLLGIVILTLPLLIRSILILISTQLQGPGFITMMDASLILAYDYVATAFYQGGRWTVSLGGFALFIVLKGVCKRTWSTSIFLTLLCLHVFAGYLLRVAYYHHLSVNHSLAEVHAQLYAEQLPLASSYKVGRQLVVDEEEHSFYLSFDETTTTNLRGLLKYDLSQKKEIAIFQHHVGDHFIVRSHLNQLIVSGRLEEKIWELDASTLTPSGRIWEIRPHPDRVALLDEQRMMVQIEFPWNSPDLLLINLNDDSVQEVWIPKPPLMTLNAMVELAPDRNELFVLHSGNDQTQLTKVSYNGEVLASIIVDGISWEAHYSPIHKKLFVPSLTEKGMLAINPNDLSITQYPLPNGIREITEDPQGVLILGDYLRGKIYLYQVENARILHTLLVGVKPEAMDIGKKSGKLYTYSGYGLIIFDLPALLLDPH